MTKQEFDKEMSRLKKLNVQKEYQNKLKTEKYKYRRKLETSKLLAVYLFAVLNAIVIFAMAAMWHFKDLTYLGVLITDIAAQILIYGIYCLKAYKGKQSEETLKFEREKLTGSLSDILNAGAECDSPVPVVIEDAETVESNHSSDDEDIEEGLMEGEE